MFTIKSQILLISALFVSISMSYDTAAMAAEAQPSSWGLLTPFVNIWNRMEKQVNDAYDSGELYIFTTPPNKKKPDTSKASTDSSDTNKENTKNATASQSTKKAPSTSLVIEPAKPKK